MDDASPSAVSAPALLTPVAPGERIEILDILRGFALFGILWMNIWYYSAPAETIHDRASYLIGLFLARGKFFHAFAFLFGVGFALQMHRARARGAPVVPTYLRRLVVLLVIGVAHRILFYPGEVLVQYALAGFFLIFFRNCSTRWLLAPAALLLCYSMFFWPVKAYFEGQRRPEVTTARTAHLDQLAAEAADAAVWQARRSMHDGSYLGSVKVNAEPLVSGYKSNRINWLLESTKSFSEFGA